MRHTVVKIFVLLFLAGCLQSCSNSRRLKGSETLYTGARVEITDDVAGRSEKKLLKSDLEGLVRPNPNKKTWGVRLKLSLYNLAGDTKKKKGLRYWLRSKVGQAPVLTSSVDLNSNRELMKNFLENRGYFNGSVLSKFEVKKNKKTTSVFNVITGPQYIINEVLFRKDSTEIWQDIDSNFSETLLKPGNGYNLDVIKAERVRIDRMLKEVGYYYFSSDYILVVADSSIGNHRVNMYVRLKKKEIPPEAYRKFHVNDIYIFTNYRLSGRDQDTGKAQAKIIGDYHIIDPKNSFKPEVFDNVMIIEKGDEYSLDDQNATLSRLVNMGNFKFVKNRFDPVGDTLLDVYYYLTPYPKKSLRFEVGANTQNDNRAGTKGSVSWRHRNAFKGSEEFMFKLNGGFEAQYSGPVKQPTIYNFGAEASLSFPRFVVPFIDISTMSRYLPHSVIKLRYNFESSAKLINISSYSGTYGYVWREGPGKEHQLFPFNLTYVRTDTVGSPQSLGILYGNLVFNGIIIGPTYEFTYNSQNNSTRKGSVFFNGRADLSGNLLGIAQKADYATDQKTIFGSPYAQYVKVQPDFRYYYKLSSAGILATRILAGFGMPYGNSVAMPNIKQFWAGGNSDLRGFPSRLVGPGTFNEYDSANSRRYIQTLGDLKLEFNIELRQRIYKFLNLGLFAEAGNVWLYRNNPDFPGATFTSNFYKELAADVGAGLRFDFKILILRLDMGMPVRKPWLPEGQRWVGDDINFSDKDWRQKNLIFNLAIGYPF